jgi:integrase
MRLTATEIRRLGLRDGASEAIVFDDEVPGFGVRLRATGSKTFVFQYKTGSKQRRLTLGPVATIGLAQARDTARDLYAKVRLGSDPAGEKAQARLKAGETFAAVAAVYLRHQQQRLRPKSYVQLQRHLTRYAKPGLRGLLLEKVTKRDIAACISSVRTTSGLVSGNRTRATLSAFFTWAMGEGLIEANPVTGTNRADEKSRERVLDAAELRLIWNALGDDDLGVIMKLLMLSGQRANEIAALRFSEIRGDTIVLPGERTKNGRSHTIPLSQTMRDILARQQPREGRDQVFGRRGQYNNWGHGMAALKDRIAETGHRLPHWTAHDLRRSFATHTAELGIAPHIIEAILNHVSGHKAGVAGIYNRASYEPEKRAALERWAAHLLAIVEGRESNVTPLRRA